MSKRKIKTLSISDKLKIVNEFQKGKPQGKFQKAFGVPRSTISRIYSKAIAYKMLLMKDKEYVKKLKKSEFPDLERQLIQWIKFSNSRNVSIGGNAIKEKAKNR